MSHRHSGACGCAEDAKQADATGTSLFASIDQDRVWCLNEAEADAGRRCMRQAWHERNEERGRLLSDPDDGEMLLHIPFTAGVHVRSISIMAWGDWRPKKIKLYVNRDDLDLSSVHDTAAAQELELVDDVDGYLDYPLKQSKFQNVNSLLLFVTEAVGEGQSGIQHVNLKGVSTKNKREIVNVVYESRANPADHNKLHEASSASQFAQ